MTQRQNALEVHCSAGLSLLCVAIGIGFVQSVYVMVLMALQPLGR